MVAARKYIDNAPTATLTTAITSGATTFSVVSAIGLPASFPYYATLDINTASAEVISVTNVAAGVVTCVRNANGLGAFAHSGTPTLTHTAVALDFQEANNHVVATTAVHGITGALVGTTDVQTLSGKTLSAPAITSATMSGTTSTAALTSSATVTGASLVATTGNITATAGDVVATAGDVTAPNGAVLSPGYRTQLLWHSADNLNTNSWTTLNSASLVGPTVQFDTLGANGVGVANGNLTIPATGVYEISARVSTTNTTGTVGARVEVNGALVAAVLTAGVASTATVCSIPVQQHSLTVGDLVQLRAFSSVSSMTLFPGAGYTTFILLKRIS